MSVVDDNAEYEDEDRQVMEWLEEQAKALEPRHFDGILWNGVYQVGELPVAAWGDEDREQVGAWVDGIFGEGTFANTYRIEVERPHITAFTYHLDDAGHRHLANHCEGQSTTLGVRPTTGLLSKKTMIEVFCVGCEKVVGRIPHSMLGMRDYSTFFKDDHTVCSNPPIVALIEE